jgi:hypothetical protein
MRQAGAFAVSVALLVLSVTPAIAAAGARLHLDQAQTQFSGALSVRGGASQTIRAGQSGKVERLDLPLCTSIKGSVVRVTITMGSRRASTSLRFQHSYSDCIWYRFTFKKPVSVHRGQVLRVTVTRVAGESPLWGWSSAHHNAYPRGKGSWQGSGVEDFAFREYVVSGG